VLVIILKEYFLATGYDLYGKANEIFTTDILSVLAVSYFPSKNSQALDKTLPLSPTVLAAPTL